MRRSNTRRFTRLAGLTTAFLLMLTEGLIAGPAYGQASVTRFVDIIEVGEGSDQATISVQFTCAMRYVTHIPENEGQEVRIELQPLPECGIKPGQQVFSDLPPVSGGADIMNSARIDSDVPGQVTLVLQFKKAERFVIAQGSDPRGMRIRLFDRRRGQIIVQMPDTAEATANYAINLESQPKAFDEATIQRARDRLKAQIFVSETSVDGDKWYRLRAGPIGKRSEADGLLNQALKDYPRAWLALGDDATTTDATGQTSEGGLPAVQQIGSDPPLDAATRKKLLVDARAALSSRKFPQAIELLTRLQRQPEFPERAAAQELLGLARERAGQLAHAKAEYEEYLRQYPTGEAADRIRTRLKTLRLASATAHGRGATSSQQMGWSVTGGFGQLLRHDGTKIDNTTSSTLSNQPTPDSTSTSANALINDLDVLARRRGEKYDLLGRVSVGYSKNFGGQFTGGNDKRFSVASLDWIARDLGILARVGRQSRNEDGVLGTFDGLFVSYQWRPSWALRTAFGYPVEQTNAGPKTYQRFESVGLAYTPPGRHWDASLFVANETYQGYTDRKAVGLEGRYLGRTGSLTSFLDYDVKYRSLNSATLVGSQQLPDHWNLSFDIERRNSPVLTTRNALIGQNTTSLAELQSQQEFPTVESIYQLARDRTARSSNYSITATRPLGQRYQFSATVSSSNIGATPASSSGSIPEEPATTDRNYQMQLYGSNIFKTGDFFVYSVAHTNDDSGSSNSFGITSRFPVHGAWRVGPRLTLDRRKLTVDNSTETQLLPSVLVDYFKGRNLFQSEIGQQIGKRDATLQSQTTKRLYLSLSYRIGF